MDEFLTTMETANILKCSVETVRVLERKGGLMAIRTSNGRIRLFKRDEVEKVALERANRPGRKDQVEWR